MDKNQKKHPFLKDKPYLLSCCVAFSVLVITYTFMSITGAVGGSTPFDEWNVLGLFCTVAFACFFMSLTDKLNVKNNMIIALIDIGDIIVSVFGVNYIAALFINKSGLFFNSGDIVIVLLTIVFTYSMVCLVFFISNIKCERDINEKIRKMKRGGKDN